MDGFDVEGLEAPETERTRRDRMLLRLVAEATPREFWVGIGSGIRRAYKETLERNQNDSNILQQHIGFKTTSDRHFYVDKILHDVSLEFGFVTGPELIKINRWRYTQTIFGGFTSIQKFSRNRRDLPKPAVFRKRLAQAGGISIQDDLLTPRPVTKHSKSTMNGILIHGPVSRNPRCTDFGNVGFICYAIPYSDYSEWGAILDIDKIVQACQNQVIDAPAQEGARTDVPAPVWRVRPNEAE